MTYYGYWGNGSTYNNEPYEDTSLRRLRKAMRQIARGNNTGGGGWWTIWDTDDADACNADEAHMVAEGRV